MPNLNQRQREIATARGITLAERVVEIPGTRRTLYPGVETKEFGFLGSDGRYYYEADTLLSVMASRANILGTGAFFRQLSAVYDSLTIPDECLMMSHGENFPTREASVKYVVDNVDLGDSPNEIANLLYEVYKELEKLRGLPRRLGHTHTAFRQGLNYRRVGGPPLVEGGRPVRAVSFIWDHLPSRTRREFIAFSGDGVTYADAARLFPAENARAYNVDAVRLRDALAVEIPALAEAIAELPTSSDDDE